MRLRRLVIRSLCIVTMLLGSALGEGRALASGSHPLRVQSGVLTVDGLTVKTAVDLQISRFHYLYIYVPGSGTAVISEQPFAGAREQKAAFRGNTLTVFAGDRRLQLTAAKRLRGTRSAFVRFDRGIGPGTRVPAVSFGDAAMVPAIWPDEEMISRGPHIRLKVKGRRALRTGKLCRPSPHGREVCATVREVVYKP